MRVVGTVESKDSTRRLSFDMDRCYNLYSTRLQLQLNQGLVDITVPQSQSLSLTFKTI